MLSFSYLPVVRMPLLHVWLAAETWFSSPKPPSSSKLGQRLGYNSDRCGALWCFAALGPAFLVAESRCAELNQANRTFSGPLEVDGTSIKKHVAPLPITTSKSSEWLNGTQHVSIRMSLARWQHRISANRQQRVSASWKLAAQRP